MNQPVFRHLDVALWRQYDSISIDIHPRLTVITGANGSGKSTLLSLLAQHFGWNRAFLATPRKGKDGALSYLSGLIQDIKKRFEFRGPNSTTIGRIVYSNDQVGQLVLHTQNSFQMGVGIAGQMPVYGLLIDSHRPTSTYSQVTQIPLQPMTAAQSFNNYNGEMMQRYVNAFTGSSPIFRMKESLISMGIFGEGNRSLGGGNQDLLETFNGFNTVLRKLLPESLGFKEIAIRTPEVVLITESGDFMLDASSGGIMTIIDVAWRIYMFSRDKDDFVVIMDEPENHLHPSMQRTLMRRLLNSFPRAQFIIATHSPFMVTSVKDSNVYVLRYLHTDDTKDIAADVGISAGRRVYSEKLGMLNKAASAGDILREVLGVPATIPEWVEDDLSSIVRRYRGQAFSSQLMDNLRGDLTASGYEEYFADAVGKLAQVQ